MKNSFVAILTVILWSINLTGCSASSTSQNDQSANVITVVQTASVATAPTECQDGCNSISVNLPNVYTHGDLLYVVLQSNELNVQTSTGFTVTDAFSNFADQNPYISVVSGTSPAASCGTTVRFYGYYFEETSDGALQVNATLNTNSATAIGMTVFELKGAHTFDSLTPCSCSNQNGCTTFATNSIELKHADEILIGAGSFACSPGGCSQTLVAQPGQGFTNVQSPFSLEYEIATAPGSYQGAFTTNVPAVVCAFFAAFY
jgi:hypothetical protein